MIKFDSKTTHSFNATLRTGQEVKLYTCLLSQRGSDPHLKLGQLYALDAHSDVDSFVDLTELEAEAVLFRALTPLNLTVTPDSLLHESQYPGLELEDMQLNTPGQRSWVFETTVADADYVEATGVDSPSGKTASSAHEKGSNWANFMPHPTDNQDEPCKPSVFALLHDCYNRLLDVTPSSEMVEQYRMSDVKAALDAHFRDWDTLLANNEPHMIAHAIHVDGKTAGQYDLAEWHNDLGNTKTHPHPLFARETWVKSVMNGNNEGYWEWVSSEIRGISVEEALAMLEQAK